MTQDSSAGWVAEAAQVRWWHSHLWIPPPRAKCSNPQKCAPQSTYAVTNLRRRGGPRLAGASPLSLPPLPRRLMQFSRLVARFRCRCMRSSGRREHVEGADKQNNESATAFAAEHLLSSPLARIANVERVAVAPVTPGTTKRSRGQRRRRALHHHSTAAAARTPTTPHP